jgi:hypothetical protein
MRSGPAVITPSMSLALSDGRPTSEQYDTMITTAESATRKTHLRTCHATRRVVDR